MNAALDMLLSRRSVAPRHLVAPAPTDAHLALMVQAALRAPDHGALAPFRFAVVRGDGARQQLAQLFTQAARDAGKDAAAAAQDAERALRPPLTVALVARIAAGHAAVPACEQWIAVGAALAQFLAAAHALGYAGKMLSGAKARHPALQAAFCAPGETLVGWIALGSAAEPPVRDPATKPRADAVCADWPAPA